MWSITSEQTNRINEAAKFPPVFTKDSPKLTNKQLAEFRPVNFATWEERYQAMVQSGVVEEDQDAEVENPELILAVK